MIGRYILVFPLHYKYDGLHSCRSKECVGRPGVEASCRVQDVSSSGLTAVDHTPAARGKRPRETVHQPHVTSPDAGSPSPYGK